MASSFVHAPRFESGSSTVDVWLCANWDKAAFATTVDDLIAVHDGSYLPVKECAVVFRNFRRAGGAYFADPVAIVQYRSGMPTAIDGPAKFSHPVVHHNDVLVPLGTPDWSSEKTRIVLQQSARQWVSGGRNDADMSDDHVITLYYAALQQLVFHGGNETTAEGQATWFPALVALTKAFAAVHAAFEAARRITAALVLTPGVNDMIQKGLAYVFHSETEWSAESRLNMLGIAIRRNLRHADSELVGMAPGPFVLFVLVPLLRDVAHPMGAVLPESAALLDRFNAATSALLRAFVADKAASEARVADGEWTTVHGSRVTARAAATAALNGRLLVSLTTAMGAPLTLEQAQKLLRHCVTTDPSAEPTWATWGVLPAAPKLTPVVATDRFSVAGRLGATYRVQVKAQAPDHFQVYSYKGVEWAAIGFKTPGTYTVKAGDLGIAERGVGDTRGYELTANWRITAGTDVLPRSTAGYSLCGQEYVRHPHGGWDYKSSPPLSMEAPFIVEVTPVSVKLSQGGRVVFTMRKTGRDPALLAFKNLWLDVHYAAPALPPPTAAAIVAATAAAQRVAHGPPRSWAEAAARGTPTAALAMLRTTVSARS